MKGTVVATWLNTLKKQYGNEVIGQAMNFAGWQEDKIFSPLENVDDGQLQKLIQQVAKMKNISTEALWKIIGEDNIKSFYRDFPAFFQQDNLYSFLQSLFDIHVVMTKKFPGAKPPLVNIEPLGKNQALFTYQSQRGMFDYLQGLLQGSQDFFGENLQIEELEKTDTMVKYRLTFEKDIYYKKLFKTNKVLSFGFIKSIPAKLSFSLLLLNLLVFVPTIGLDKPIQLATAVTLPAFFTFLLSSLLMSPQRSITKEVERMLNNHYIEDGEILTGDYYEEFFQLIQQYKRKVRADFVGFKGITDEMGTFVVNVNTIANEMDTTSGEISGVVEQLAGTSLHQAENTEDVVSILNSNIQALQAVVENENANKDELEKAVDKISNSYSSLENTSQNIMNSLEKFQEVRDRGVGLQDKAQDMTNIVSIVSKISKQTNLLALNASIEAASAGEAGKGFSVVAEEVRTLAEQTQKAVEDIHSHLGYFVGEIKRVVESIELQYSTLEQERNSLENVRQGSHEANTSIQRVASSMIDTINDLTKETDSIASIYENVESLAAIAQENSASSQEVSANVSSYTNEIKKLLENMTEFEKIADSFKTELAQYKI
ncbi:heme NO-binding domain-containing protein [Irregularibacter muris]|uniref:Heme NO-binding domain-containing protein n=1 Tax=Irregularibacter muris TaxID=1796619 RepID=A0AAE3HH61_9FIRM|nr:heme NO-binding domain-containing protein [Irregularibacter muris]MCR1899467.1 heme NO-binding domain-containing protein [Irregularibacter muris]